MRKPEDFVREHKAEAPCTRRCGVHRRCLALRLCVSVCLILKGIRRGLGPSTVHRTAAKPNGIPFMLNIRAPNRVTTVAPILACNI